jgi:hypothetical protein
MDGPKIVRILCLSERLVICRALDVLRDCSFPTEDSFLLDVIRELIPVIFLPKTAL